MLSADDRFAITALHNAWLNAELQGNSSATRAGQIGLVLHTGSGCGGSFDTRGSDPLLLETLLNDPTLRSTTFVLLHGGTRSIGPT